MSTKDKIILSFHKSTNKIVEIGKWILNYSLTILKKNNEMLIEKFKQTKFIHHKINKSMTKLSVPERAFTQHIENLKKKYDKGEKVNEINDFVDSIMKIRKRKEYETYANAELVLEDISEFRIKGTFKNEHYKKPEFTDWGKNNHSKMLKYSIDMEKYNELLKNKSIIIVETGNNKSQETDLYLESKDKTT